MIYLIRPDGIIEWADATLNLSRYPAVGGANPATTVWWKPSELHADHRIVDAAFRQLPRHRDGCLDRCRVEASEPTRGDARRF